MNRNTVRVRVEVLAILGVTAVLSPSFAGQLLAVMTVHELGHGVLGAWMTGHPVRFDLQFGAGDAYYVDGDPWPVRRATLLAGLLPTLLYASILRAVGGPTAVAWAYLTFQAWPFPASDGGVWLRDRLEHRGNSPIDAFRRTGAIAVACTTAAVLALFVLSWTSALTWLLGISTFALVMARTEWPAVVHREVYDDWRAGRHRAVVERVRRHSAGRRARQAELGELGLLSAQALGDVEAMNSLRQRLWPLHPAYCAAARWLLDTDQGAGVRWAEDVLEQRHSSAADGRERIQEVALHFALHEARAGRRESAIGLLETCSELGELDFEWLQYRDEIQALLADPRMAALRTPANP